MVWGAIVVPEVRNPNGQSAATPFERVCSMDEYRYMYRGPDLPSIYLGYENGATIVDEAKLNEYCDIVEYIRSPWRRDPPVPRVHHEVDDFGEQIILNGDSMVLCDGDDGVVSIPWRDLIKVCFGDAVELLP